MDGLDDALRERIRSTRALPSPPTVTARLIELCEDPEAQINDVIEVLNTDPALAARLMRLANSPLHARRRRTENLRQAVTLLGFDVVLTASLSLTLSAGRSSVENRSTTFRKRRWTRSVYAAASAQLVAESSNGVDPTNAFLAALLQDIGVQVIDRLEPELYQPCDPGGTHDDLIGIEIERLGADHAAVGAMLLEAWRLPESVVDAVRWSHQPTDDGAPAMAHVVAVAGTIADGFCDEPSRISDAQDAALELLGISDDSFGMMLEYLTVVLPDMSAALDADVPSQEALTEMAEEAIVMRQMKSQSETAQLHDEVESLKNVAEELKTQSERDTLTGLSNRRRLDEMVEQEFATAVKHGFPLSILFVDLDDFKQVNDRYGHGIGDELLMQTAQRLEQAVRQGDLVGRFGGEEFIVVLPGADSAAAETVAGRLVDTFNARPFQLSGDLQRPQTASVGVATLDGDTAYDTVAELIQAADEALYAAKRMGKNQFRCATPAPAAPFAAPTGQPRVIGDQPLSV